MGRHKKHNYNRTVFAVRIEELQWQNNYTDAYVLEHLTDEKGIPIINDKQVLDSYKSGKRRPGNFDEALKAFSRFYDVTTDYLLGLSDTPNPQIKSVQEATGLSEGAVRRLVQFRDKSPQVLAMVDAIIAGTSEEDMSFFNLYRQMYNDYKDSKANNVSTGIDAEMMKMQNRVFFMQAVYDRWRKSVIAKLSEQFDREILEEQDEYEHSQEFFNQIPVEELSGHTVRTIRIQLSGNPTVTPVNSEHAAGIIEIQSSGTPIVTPVNNDNNE